MPFPVPEYEPVAIREWQSSGDHAALREVLARAQADGTARVTVVYAPTSVTHHHAAPASVAVYSPATEPYRAPSGHPGIDVDLTGYGSAYVPPVDPGPLPAIAERHEWAPLVLLVSTWGGIGSAFLALLTGNPLAIASFFAALVVSAVAFVANYRNGFTP
jgi:hypothetical protein